MLTKIGIGTKVWSNIDKSLIGSIVGGPISLEFIQGLPTEEVYYLIELDKGYWSENKKVFHRVVLWHKDSFFVLEL